MLKKIAIFYGIELELLLSDYVAEEEEKSVYKKKKP